MNASLKKELVTYLQQFITEERWQTMNQVLDNRTRFLTVVLEDIYQPHNASAVLRSCDCFGIQDIHIIENENTFSPSKGVTIGADQWLSVQKYNSSDADNTKRCYQKLREEGYRIIATTPHADDVTIDKLAIDSKTALVFGAELTGLSEQAMELADGYTRIPMVGFSESFNISVSAALCLYELSTRLRKRSDAWPLSTSKKLELQLEWLKTSVRASDKLVDRYLKEEQKTT